MSARPQYYTRTAQLLHWLMAFIFITAWFIGFYSGNFLSYATDGSFKTTMITAHKNIATPILFLIVIRIFWRYTHLTPSLPQSMSKPMKSIAHVIHWVLYLILVMLPITGCLFSWSAGYPAPVLYLFNLPTLIEPNKHLMAIIKPIHIYLSWFAGLLIVGHILAALQHHFIDKDNVLKSMISK
ncbi:cytochrome b [Acinetobacter rathckeae]|uniref:cytochrome b n=1 Tax=Acinetobacter rathckeae TaxID=2605272 RepID=UPI0018A2600E|nr:cytochrome b [Acinetobacter rathckeae]MBF7694848.1 cytochrome b [Acinetobacter rathckeae]